LFVLYGPNSGTSNEKADFYQCTCCSIYLFSIEQSGVLVALHLVNGNLLRWNVKVYIGLKCLKVGDQVVEFFKHGDDHLDSIRKGIFSISFSEKTAPLNSLSPKGEMIASCILAI
jgi:hypothetical protein